MEPAQAWTAITTATALLDALAEEVRRRGFCLPRSAAVALARWADDGGGELCVTELEFLSGVQNASYMTAKLLEAGLVERAGAPDRRLVMLRLTPAGRELAEALLELVRRLPPRPQPRWRAS